MMSICHENQWPDRAFHENVDHAISQGTGLDHLTMDEMRTLYLCMWLELISPAGNA
jgi:hypothetical protein